MSDTRFAGAVVAAVSAWMLLAGEPARAAGVPVEFQLSPGSGVSLATLSVEGQTSGTLIGDYDVATNSGGTRTKPGIFGSFGATENLPVPSSVDLKGNGSPELALSGGLRMELDAATQTVTVSGYSAQRVPGVGQDSVALSATVEFDAFRTRQPSSTFPGGFPVTIPVGDATIRTLSIVQVGSAAGSLTPISAGRFAFSVLLSVEVSGQVDALDSELPFGPLPTPLNLTGEVELLGSSAVLTSLAALDVSQAEAVNEVLPPLPFALPTVLPTGGTANVVFNLTLEQVLSNLQGEVRTLGSGVVVPEPGSLAWLAASLPMLLRRR